MNCKHCGAEVSERTKFCEQCGTPVKGEDSPASAAVMEASSAAEALDAQTNGINGTQPTATAGKMRIKERVRRLPGWALPAAAGAVVVLIVAVVLVVTLAGNPTGDNENPNRSKAEEYVTEAKEHNALGRHDEAIADCSKAIELDSDYVEAYIVRAAAFAVSGRSDGYSRAAEDCDTALELDPDCAKAYVNLASVSNSTEQYEQAIEECSKAIELDPNLAEAYNNRAFAYDYTEQFDKAIPDADRAIELKPEYAVAYNNRGLAYYMKGQHDKAIADFKKALELDPDLEIARQNLHDLGVPGY